MQLTFLTPIGATFAAGAALPLLAMLATERRARQVRHALSLEEPSRRSFAPAALALSLVPALLGLALAQPVLRQDTTQRVRADAQAFYVFDTSESMRASSRPDGPTRLTRAIKAALRMRLALPEIPSGVATMTDRVLPDLFPTPNEEVFTATLDQSVGIERPPPKGFTRRATTFAALDAFVGTDFFSPGIRHRLVILFTDGETAPYFSGDLAEELRQPPRTSFVIVRLWRPDERIYLPSGGSDPGYRPDPSSATDVRQLAAITGGGAFDEGAIGSAISAARRALGHGPIAAVGVGLHVVALAKWIVLATLVPLVALLWRRNLV